MSVFEHHRWRVFNQGQHPYHHNLTEFSYANPRIPGVANAQNALDYFTAVLYPKYIGTYANFAALPGVASANDYAIVSDDGAGFAAGYVYVTIDGVTQWIKRYDMQWSMDSILSETVNRTQYMYVQKYGLDDKDATGATIAGLYAGQRVYGGASASTNLTLSANANESALAGPVAVVWNHMVGMVTTGADSSGLSKSGVADALWNAIAWSDQVIPHGTSGYIQVSGVADVHPVIGLTNVSYTSGDTYITPAYGLQPQSVANGGGVQIWEAGSPPFFDATAWVGTDVFRVETDGSTVTYKKNGVTFYTSLVAVGVRDLFPVCSGYQTGAQITASSVSFGTGTVGAGFVQVDDNLRPTYDNKFTSGTLANRWSDVYALNLHAGTLTASSGQVTDSSGAISFGANNLATTGTLAAGIATLASGSHVGNLTLASGSITDSGGAISFNNNNLSTTGTLSAGVSTLATGSHIGNLTLGNGSIVDSLGSISFGANNLSTTGNITATNGTLTQLSVGNLQLAANTISALNANGNITLTPNGTGLTQITGSATVSSNLTVTGFVLGGNLELSGNTLSSQNLNGNIALTPNGTGLVALSAGIYPAVSASIDSGKSGNLWNNVWISGGIKNGTNTYAISDLMALRNNTFRDTARTLAAQTGDVLFYDAVSGTWLASVPDTEITHSTLSGLLTGDAGHTQFVMLAGRAGGQAVQGGTAASENLTLESTSNVTKGSIFVKDPLKPFTDASFAVSWSGTDLGDSTHNYRDVYTKGVFKGFRLENFTSITLPSAAASNTGRLVYSTDNNKVYADTGGTWVVAGVGKFVSDIAFDGVQLTATVTVSATIADARNAIWQLCDNLNSYERIYTKITCTSATTVVITTTTALPAGSYRLIGVE